MDWRDEHEPLRLIQITDLHLQAEKGVGLGWCGRCRMLDTEATLATVLDDIQINEAHFDALVVTGDIAQDGELQAYATFRRLLGNEGVPVYCLPGNHDHVPHLKSQLDGQVISMPQYIEARGWLLVFLHSTVPGESWGEISLNQIEWLASLLERYATHHVAIFTHHHPVSIGSEWLDCRGILNGEHLLERLQAWPQVKLIVCGHIHQELDRQLEGLRVLGTPSTCLQFEPSSELPCYTPTPPAYRAVELHPQGDIQTNVVYSHQRWLKSA